MHFHLLDAYERLLIIVARFALVVLSTISLLAITGTLVWIVFAWINLASTSYQDVMKVPTYETIDSTWKSIPQEEANRKSSELKVPPIYYDSIEIIDSLYQLVGREEPKFSEQENSYEFYARLVQPFGGFDQRESTKYTTDFLIEFKSFTQSMTKDELLKRIANVEDRTTLIVDSIFQFRDAYIENLRVALAKLAEQSATQGWNRSVTSSLTMQVLIVCVVAFVVSSICLLGFQVVRSRPTQPSIQTVANESDNHG